MNKFLMITSAFALGLGAAVFAGQMQDSQPKPLTPKVGSPAPEFTLTDTKGTSHDLTDFRGKWVVLEWTNHQCPFVVKHYKNGDMQNLQKWATGKGAIWLSIVSSAEGKQGYVTADQANGLLKEKGFNSTAMLLDPTGLVGKIYAAKTTPHMFVINPEGMLAYMGGIDDNPSPNPDDVKKARNHVKMALEEGMAGKPISVTTSQPYGCSVKY